MGVGWTVGGGGGGGGGGQTLSFYIFLRLHPTKPYSGTTCIPCHCKQNIIVADVVNIISRYQQALALYPPVNPAACMADRSFNIVNLFDMLNVNI